MGAKLGNQNAKGNKGGGRHPITLEREIRKQEEELMYQVQDVEEVKERLKQKKYSVRDAMLAKELLGNETLISRHYHKVVPDRISQELIVKGEIYIDEDIAKKNDITPLSKNDSKGHA